MNLYAKGKVLKQDGDMATIQISNEELGRAVLNYVVSNADNGVGERFMQNLFAGKPMTLNELLMSNVIEAKKMSDIESNNESLKKNYREVTEAVEPVANNSEYNVNSDTDGDIGYSSEDNSSKIELLKEQETIQVGISVVKDTCPRIFKNVFKTKNGISSQILSNCEIAFTFAENNVTYSFMNYKKGIPDVITPNKNLVFIWDKATSKELDELISLI